MPDRANKTRGPSIRRSTPKRPAVDHLLLAVVAGRRAVLARPQGSFDEYSPSHVQPSSTTVGLKAFGCVGA